MVVSYGMMCFGVKVYVIPQHVSSSHRSAWHTHFLFFNEWLCAHAFDVIRILNSLCLAIK